MRSKLLLLPRVLLFCFCVPGFFHIGFRPTLVQPKVTCVCGGGGGGGGGGEKKEKEKKEKKKKEISCKVETRGLCGFPVVLSSGS